MKQRVCVSCLVRKEGSYLLIKQNKPNGAYPDTYHTPGGGIDSGEPPEDAVKREILEETGIILKNIKPSHFDSDIFENYKGEPHQLFFLQYTADYGSGTPIPGDDASEILWATKERLKELPLNPPTKKWLTDIGIMEG